MRQPINEVCSSLIKHELRVDLWSVCNMHSATRLNYIKGLFGIIILFYKLKLILVLEVDQSRNNIRFPS